MVYGFMRISLYHFKGKDTSYFVFLSFKPDSSDCPSLKRSVQPPSDSAHRSAGTQFFADHLLSGEDKSLCYTANIFPIPSIQNSKSV
jgi:hypothetical protein